jgi:peptidase M28-like protein
MILPRFCLLLAVAGVASGQSVEFTSLTPGVLEERLRLAHPQVAERYRRLRTLFEQTGCDASALREQIVRGSKEPNLICSVPGTGESARKILVGAHFDHYLGDGVINNWTGAILMPSLAELVRSKPHRHSFEFIGFAAEEKGLLGSKAYVKALSKDDRKQIAAVVTMDSLGLSSTKFWPNGSTKELGIAAARIAMSLQLDFGGVNVDQVGTTDSATFKAAGIPVLSLHSITQETWRLINSEKDVWGSLSWKSHYDSHRLISALLVYLDQSLP